MDHHKKSKKNFKILTSVFAISLFTFTQVFSFSAPTFAEPEAASSQIALQSSVVTLHQANQSIQTPVQVQSPINSSLHFMSQGTPLSVPYPPIVSRPHRKAEDTNNPNISYNFEKDGLVLYTRKGPKQYEKRTIDWEDESINSNNDVQSVRISDDGKLLVLASPTSVYAIKIETDSYSVEKLMTLNWKTLGYVSSVNIERQDTLNHILIHTSKKQTIKFNGHSFPGFRRIEFKSAPDQPYEAFLDEAKNDEDVFVPKMVGKKEGSGWSAFIVQGAPDIFSVEKNDIYVKPAQKVEGFTVLLGSANNQYGLVFQTLNPATQKYVQYVVDYPTQKTLIFPQADGTKKIYNIQITDQGIVLLELED